MRVVCHCHFSTQTEVRKLVQVMLQLISVTHCFCCLLVLYAVNRAAESYVTSSGEIQCYWSGLLFSSL